MLGLVLEQVTGETIGDLYCERIIEPLGLEGTSFPDLPDNFLPDPHAQGYTFFGQSSGGEPASYLLGSLLGMDGRLDDLHRGGLTGLRAGVGHRRGSAPTRITDRAARLIRR